MAYKQNNPFNIRSSKLNIGMKEGEEIVPGVRVIRTNKLKPGVLGEANDDNSIFISDTIAPGSIEETKILTHEVKHLVDMETGRFKYTPTSITWDGQEYPRENGMVLYDGKWQPEGGEFPWESHK